MGTLKDRLNEDLHTAMKARDELITSTLRMALSAVRTAEVAGKEARELSDEEVLSVLTKMLYIEDVLGDRPAKGVEAG